MYLNLEAEVTEKLSGGVALRHERYSDFGSTTSAKGSARYAFNDQVAIRGTAPSGFRAPSLAQQHYTITTTNFMLINGQNTAVETGTFAVDSPAALALGAQPLKAEKARNLSLGVQWQPTRNLSSSVDLYQIEIDDRILFSGNLNLANTTLRNDLAAQGVYVGAARYFTNSLDTRTRGLDWVSTYRMNLRQGERLDLTLAYNRNETDVLRVSPNPELLPRNKLVLLNRQTIRRATVGAPEDKLNLSADYTAGKWNARAGLTRYGSFTVPQNDPAMDQVHDPQWVLDLSGGVRLPTHWKLSAGIDNATNRVPAQITSLGNLNNNGIKRYSGYAPNGYNGYNGRYFYAKAAYSW
ncbi:MAG: iron complex outerrane recepter protein [Massilia sp.]